MSRRVAFGATELGPEQRRALTIARRLEWGSIAYLLSAVTVIFLVMGNSQAMRAAWIEDALGFLPPVVFLLAVRLARREPDADHPYGFHRAVAAAHLAASVALLVLGGFLVVDSALTLVRTEHPTIGTMTVFGHTVWQGWLMIAALVYTGFPNAILGRIKLKYAEQLHDKVLHADAEMNKADWLTAAGAIAGIVGIYFGLWWADALVALGIGASIVKDGVQNVRAALGGLLDRTARTVDDKLDAPERAHVRDLALGLDWVEQVNVRMRDLGHVYHTEVAVVPRGDGVTLEQLSAAQRALRRLDWKLADTVVIPVASLDEPDHGER